MLATSGLIELQTNSTHPRHRSSRSRLLEVHLAVFWRCSDNVFFLHFLQSLHLSSHHQRLSYIVIFNPSSYWIIRNYPFNHQSSIINHLHDKHIHQNTHKPFIQPHTSFVEHSELSHYLSMRQPTDTPMQPSHFGWRLTWVVSLRRFAGAVPLGTGWGRGNCLWCAGVGSVLARVKWSNRECECEFGF